MHEGRRQEQDINQRVSCSSPYRRVLRTRAGKDCGQAPTGEAANDGRGNSGDVEQREGKCFENDGVLFVPARAEGFGKAADS